MSKTFRVLLVVGLLALTSKLFVGVDPPVVGQSPSSFDVATPPGSSAPSELEPAVTIEAQDVAAGDQERNVGRVPDASEEVFQAEPAVKMFVMGSKVNVRDAPSLEGKSLGQLVEGTVVNQIAQADGWSQIQTPLGQGWMATRFLSDEMPSKVVQVEPRRIVATPSSSEITAARAELIRQSIASYPGSCPCPYNVDRAGRRCGGRSAWSKPGGYSPICYESDVSEERLETYFARIRGAAD
jgi:hypothetical protein